MRRGDGDVVEVGGEEDMAVGFEGESWSRRQTIDGQLGSSRRIRCFLGTGDGVHEIYQIADIPDIDGRLEGFQGLQL